MTAPVKERFRGGQQKEEFCILKVEFMNCRPGHPYVPLQLCILEPVSFFLHRQVLLYVQLSGASVFARWFVFSFP